jgi:hypothetical protein
MNKLLAIVLVGAASFVAGILLAPKSGKETRKDLMDKGNEYKAKANAGLKEVKKGSKVVKAELSQGAQSIKEIAKDAEGGMKRTADRLKEEAGARAKAIQGEVKQTSQDARNAAAK